MAAYEFTVTAKAQYLPAQSHPENSEYTFEYMVTIRNTGQIAAQLVARHWVITDASNRKEEMLGFGVMGQQPTLQPGEEFEYANNVTLAMSQGTMSGQFLCEADDGEQFHASVPEFALSSPQF
ncbi:MAG TPA: Co2+/Mg2+ efflux protein ApaG [Burkholderiaceae bacterium]|jgi:ApaG protein|nr:Co2+/Mg2+ efflux protein ApaG [Burkholderiaceae bacterium]